MTAFDPKIYRNSKDGIGGPGDDAATNSTSAWTTVALLKGLYQLLGVSGIAVSGGTMATAAKQDTGNTTLTAIDGHVDGLETLVTSSNTKLDTLHADIATTQAGLVGGLTETAPATDTASSGLNGRLQRIAQRLTSLIALVPASLGAKTAAASFSVTTATDDALIAPIGIVTETAPATDTASSGLNGRLQRIAQRITSLIALFYARALPRRLAPPHGGHGNDHGPHRHQRRRHPHRQRPDHDDRDGRHPCRQDRPQQLRGRGQDRTGAVPVEARHQDRAARPARPRRDGRSAGAVDRGLSAADRPDRNPHRQGLGLSDQLRGAQAPRSCATRPRPTR
jgi:hypothetical protein